MILTLGTSKYIFLLKGTKEYSLVSKTIPEGASFRSRNGYVASIIYTGKIIGYKTGKTKIEIFKEDKVLETIKIIVLPWYKKSYPVFITRKNGVTDSFIPDNLIKVVRGQWNWNPQNDVSICEEVALAFNEMMVKAEHEGILMGIGNAYRSYKEQEDMLNESIKMIGVIATNLKGAPAGYSEHHTGLALDVGGRRDWEGCLLTPNADVYKWIADHCHEYGFMLKNLKGKEHITGTIYEPWHIRFLGDLEIAKTLYDNQWTLDEYLNQVDE